MDRVHALSPAKHGPEKQTQPRPRNRTPSKPDRTLPERRKPEPERPGSRPPH